MAIDDAIGPAVIDALYRRNLLDTTGDVRVEDLGESLGLGKNPGLWPRSRIDAIIDFARKNELKPIGQWCCGLPSTYRLAADQYVLDWMYTENGEHALTTWREACRYVRGGDLDEVRLRDLAEDKRVPWKLLVLLSHEDAYPAERPLELVPDGWDWVLRRRQ